MPCGTSTVMALISFSRQAGLGWLSPDEYGAAWHTDQDDHPAAHAAQPDPAAAR